MGCMMSLESSTITSSCLEFSRAPCGVRQLGCTCASHADKTDTVGVLTLTCDSELYLAQALLQRCLALFRESSLASPLLLCKLVHVSCQASNLTSQVTQLLLQCLTASHMHVRKTLELQRFLFSVNQAVVVD